MAYGKHRQVLLGNTLRDEEVRALLAPAGFADWRSAYRRLQRVAPDSEARQVMADFLPHLVTALAATQNPDQVLATFERFVASTPNRLDLLHFLAHYPRTVEQLVTLFAGSQFLTEILLRNPEYFRRLAQRRNLAHPKSAHRLYEDARAAMVGVETAEEQMDALRRFQRWELLRIGVCDLLDLWDLSTVTAQLSHLADGLVRACLDIAVAQSGTPATGFAVLALGKLGGQELNYSSDIDLLFVATSSTLAYRRLGERLIEALTRITAEGFLYRVDMRLRPWGRVGPLVSSLNGHISYLKKHARSWEKQALLKARAVAGDVTVGNAFLQQTEPLIFNMADEMVRADVREMKQRIEMQLRQRGREWGEVKLGQGSIRDVEFVTQYLQLVHGARCPQVRSGNTLEALAQLHACGLLPEDEYRVLVDGYTFLRTVEHHLQLMHYQQTHTLPEDAERIAHLARRLGFDGADAGAQFLSRYEQHCAAIRAVYQRRLGGNNVILPINLQALPLELRTHLERMGPSYAQTFSREEIRRHVALAARLDEEHLVEVEAVPLENERWQVTIVGYDYPGELSLICGLLFVHGFNIIDGQVFTSEVEAAPRLPAGRGQRRRRPPAQGRKPLRRTIVDVFTVRPVQGKTPAEVWTRYAEDLAGLLHLMEAGRRQEAQGELAKRVAHALRNVNELTTTLYPVEIEIDNETSEKYTVLHIDAPDTVGFLYEFTNALALNGIYISRVVVRSIGRRVHDTLYVTDARGRKITAPDRQRELRVATVLVKQFTHLLPRAPNPEAALLHFREFLGQLFMRPDWPDELALLERPEVLDALAQLLGVSDFLWNDFLRMQHANLFPVVRDVDALVTRQPKEQVRAELDAALRGAADQDARREALNAFKDREMFRIDMRYILGHVQEYWQFSVELTELAEVVVEAAYQLCYQNLCAQHGEPQLENGQPCPLSVCALGKLGGREMGFASDIELMFIYAGSGRTAGPNVISTAEFYERLVQSFLHTIRAKREGIFEVDLRLRPYGRAGSLAVSLEAFERYFAPGGAAWPYERQALVRLRPIAGDEAFGRRVVALRDALIYTGEPFDVAAMRAMRERQLRHLVTGGTINVKFSLGGLVDLEYLIQGLQIAHGHHNASLRVTNTRAAMMVLATVGILTPAEYARLSEAHTFLRRLIEALRIVRGNARDLTVPSPGSEEFLFLARRLGYGNDQDRLRHDLTRHMANVQEMRERLLG